jgi:hypothetical protein
MSTRVTSSEVALFDSVSGMPLPTPVFGSTDEAEAFLIYVMRESSATDPRSLLASEIAALRAEWEARREDD